MTSKTNARLCGCAMVTLCAFDAAAVEPDRLFVDGMEACSMMIDADGDRLYECDEVYAKTDPALADTDSDGLSDGDEVLGTIDGLNLPAFGTKPLKKDILIEYDWAEDSNGCVAHSHGLTPAQYESMRTVFADAPVTNPDGTTGINLIQDYGQRGLFTGGGVLPLPTGHLDGDNNGPARIALKSAHFAANRVKYFHYATLVHSFGVPGHEASGKSDFHNDFITATGCWGQTAQSMYRRRNTVLHELGHDLSLWHGGAWADNCNFKPNYNSVMNYRYQLNGIDLACTGSPSYGVDRDSASSTGYSTGTLPPLDETALDETKGVCSHLFSPPPVDWNYNHVIESVLQFDINPGDLTPAEQQAACGGSGIFSILTDHDDWSAVDLTRVRTDPSASGGIEDSVECALPLEVLP